MTYAQGCCSLYNLFYLAYEKSFKAETLNSKLYEDYQQEGLAAEHAKGHQGAGAQRLAG